MLKLLVLKMYPMFGSKYKCECFSIDYLNKERIQQTPVPNNKIATINHPKFQAVY